jgi:hypothetical protein
MSRETNVLSTSSVSPASPSTCDSELQESTLRIEGRHLIPFPFVLYITSFLDRVNVGFAALEMNHDLRFGPAVYGFGAGVFFISYALFEVPSNLILARTALACGSHAMGFGRAGRCPQRGALLPSAATLGACDGRHSDPNAVPVCSRSMLPAAESRRC